MAKDEFFFSPDAGRVVLRGNTYYSEHGHAFKEQAGGVMRLMPVAPFENYADWSPAKRRKVLAETKRAARADRAKRAREQARRRRLVESAKAKITEEEFNAVRWLDDER